MIKGAKFWSDRSKYYIQTNNSLENLMKKKYKTGYLETCGPTAAINCMAVLGYGVKTICREVEFQPEDILSLFMNDPSNKAKFERIRKGVDYLPGNRVPQFYPWAVMQLFNVECEFKYGDIERIRQSLIEGNSIQLLLKRPGHYIAAVAIDTENWDIIINDPWPNRFKDKNGFNRRISIKEYKSNVRNYYVEYKG